MTTKLRDDDPRHYEGLVRTTSRMYADVLRVELEDLEQVLRFRAWRAIEGFQAERSQVYQHGAKRSPRERFVYLCIKNQIRDLMKSRMRRDNTRPDWMGEVTGIREVYFEDVAPDLLGRYVGDTPEDRFDDEVVLPATLTSDERRVVAFLYLDYSQVEIATLLQVRARDVGTHVSRIKEKMADWRPDLALRDDDIVQLPWAA